MKRRTQILLALIAVIIVILFGWWYSRVPTTPALMLSKTPLVRTLQFSARVATSSRVDTGSTLTGRVSQVLVIEGAAVKKGDVLARLENDELSAALAQAQANERQASARLVGLRTTGRSATQSTVSQANSVLVAAQSEFDRTKALVAKGFLSEARLDEVKRALAVAQAQLVSAQAQRAANGEQGTDIEQAKAQLSLANAATNVAKARLTQAVISAPVDAKVLTRLVEPGQIVQPGRTLFSLALAGPMQLLGQVDERNLGQMRVGQTATVIADAYPSQRFQAKVQSISPLVDAQRGAIEVKFELLQDPPAFLREDMTLSVEVETARLESALVIPVNALQGDNLDNTSVVFIEQEGRVEKRVVRLGLRTLNSAEVIEGLVPGDLVLLGKSLKVGSRVRADTSSSAASLMIKPQGQMQGKSEDAGAALTNAMGR